MQTSQSTVGARLREWRQRRRLSQMDLALDAEISTRHLSFVETGRAAPSRDMVLRLADELDVPLRERNALLLAAGFAPVFAEHGLEAPALASARQGIEALLRAQEPWPALAVDRHWTLALANAGVRALMTGAAPHLLEPPVNVLRLSLHPDGLAPRIANLGAWKAHLLHRLRRQYEATADGALGDLLDELDGYPAPADDDPDPDAVAVPLVLRDGEAELSFLSTTLLFGSPRDVTLSELAIEVFLPADAATAARLQSGGRRTDG